MDQGLTDAQRVHLVAVILGQRSTAQLTDEEAFAAIAYVIETTEASVSVMAAIHSRTAHLLD